MAYCQVGGRQAFGFRTVLSGGSAAVARWLRQQFRLQLGLVCFQSGAAPTLDIVLPHEPVAAAASVAPAALTFDADTTTHFQTRMKKAPEWFCSFMASNTCDKRRKSNARQADKKLP